MSEYSEHQTAFRRGELKLEEVKQFAYCCEHCTKLLKYIERKKT
jgi:hypothetical protein